jgi:rhomboid family GlyGly-CTERM serine protease
MRLSKSHSKITTNILVSLLVGLAVFVCAIFPDTSFPLLSLERAKVNDGELWRIFSSNFVHFGWTHTVMNVAAFAIAAFILIDSVSPARFICLITACCFSVGVGIYYLNPEYGVYAGLSGSIHGFLIAGLMLNKRHLYWINGIFVTLILGKIFYEHQTDYQATELQDLLPVPVAYDAHLYGAIAGLVFGAAALLIDKFNPLNHETKKHSN